MTEYKTKNATVRIHGKADREQIENATVKYLKGVQKCKKEKRKEALKTSC